jgi:hypothetical protein
LVRGRRKEEGGGREKKGGEREEEGRRKEQEGVGVGEEHREEGVDPS